MVEVTLQLPDQLAARILPIQRWMPTLLALSLAQFTTPASETAAELVASLLTNPSPDEVLSYHVSERAQRRLQRLLALNRAGMLGEVEQQELDELERLEHIVIMLKADAAEQQQQEAG